MGILNVTPDSFSDGGVYLERGRAVGHALEMTGAGADILDIGGESTRPGSERISADQQMERVLPVMEEIIKALPRGYPLSIDTTLATVAEQAIKAGASIINDISAGEDDEAMFPLAAASGIHIILMHKQGQPATMQEQPHYDNVVAQVREYLLERAAAAQRAGIARENIIIDPGIGFGKTFEHNLEIMKNLRCFVETGYPVMLGSSRKSFLKKLRQVEDSSSLVVATSATTVLGVAAGVRILRVHDVQPNRQALEVAWALKGRSKF